MSFSSVLSCCMVWLASTYSPRGETFVLELSESITGSITSLLCHCFWQVMVMQEGSTSLFGQHLKLPTLPNNSLTSSFSDPKKVKNVHGSKVSVIFTYSLENFLFAQFHMALLWKCVTYQILQALSRHILHVGLRP